VIANGGRSGYDDMLAAFNAGADACAAGALFQLSELRPRGRQNFG
jgi:imidazole glycerol phosphate synthase subunit HisF